MSSSSSSPSQVFKPGRHRVKLLSVEAALERSSSGPVPPKPMLIWTPCEEDEFPVLIFLHGFLLHNSFYSELLQHVSSHGFIVVAPQLYTYAGPDSAGEISSAARITDWLISGLAPLLPTNVLPNIAKLAVAGHSRGGKVAFALALGHGNPSLSFSAVIGVDPVDGMDKNRQTNPPILTYIPRSFDLQSAAMVIGSGLGGEKKNPFFPPCSPAAVSHREFFLECCPPACHFVARDCGHMDVLDDETKGIRGRATYCLCLNGKKGRAPMRSFVAGAIVAFMKAYLNGEMEALWRLRDDPHSDIPVQLSEISFL
ncbi:Chlorophyllase-2, chloroplastic [Apostasia shenzhenica]|uniref:Chlorophyllase-2, chloroplastic n=1 Tax=Apostasia shenzhenica TaxID=1088818 RepID=A0A2I0B0T7_9ASPA|nr:Chlorophyllase-2, chloroplastic [Apostasia shenzhenica]